eukprot:jgi/Picre1/31483/NNA_006835.t1
MLDINLFRTDKGGNPDIVRKSQRERFAQVDQVDNVLDLDGKWREARGNLDTLNMDFNALTQEIKKLRMAKEDASELIEKSKAMKVTIKEAEAKLAELEEERDAAIAPIGNLVHSSVPISDDEANNVIVREIGELRMPKELADGSKEKLYNHVDLVQLLGIAELEKGLLWLGAGGIT